MHLLVKVKFPFTDSNFLNYLDTRTPFSYTQPSKKHVLIKSQMASLFHRPHRMLRRLRSSHYMI